MDDVYAKIAENSVQFNLGDEEIWRVLYEPLYLNPPKDVHIISDIRYGPAERNHLDVFIPPQKHTEKPVLLFVHGGGFFSGDKRWSEKCWANIGYFFATHGIVVVVANHQLVPNVQFPGGADDIQLVRNWIYRNIAVEKYGSGSVDKVVLFGHSSGGAHVASNLYRQDGNGQPGNRKVFPPVAGVIYLSVPFWFDRTRPVRKSVLRQYFGSDSESVWGPLSPLGLFQALPSTSPVLNSEEVPVYVGIVKWEVKEAADAAIAFLNAYRERSKPAGTLPVFHVLDKHNHLSLQLMKQSNVLSIGTEDETQSSMLLQFIRSCVAKKSARCSVVREQSCL